MKQLPGLAQATGEEGALLDLAVAAVEMLATVANASADGKGSGRCRHMCCSKMHCCCREVSLYVRLHLPAMTLYCGSISQGSVIVQGAATPPLIAVGCIKH